MIQDGKKIKINYTLTVNEEVVDSSEKSGPLEYQHGKGQIILGLEKALDGLAVGDSKELLVKAEDAYGPVRRDAIVEIARDKLPEGDIQVGMIVSGKDKSGRPFEGRVQELTDAIVTVDFNHPLAGHDLFFQITVLEING